jgi:hypothetical protein
VTAAGSTDRLYSTVDLVNFARHVESKMFTGRFEARMVTGAAVSNADTAKIEASLRQNYRQSTAALLTALREGGPLALSLGFSARPILSTASRGFDVAFAGSLATGGENPGDASRGFTGGGTIELKGYLNADPNEITNPTSFLVTARGGYRNSPQRILTDVREHALHFVQMTIEFKSPQTGVPIGVAYTYVNSPFRKYVKGIQFFGIAGI